jgi:competence ComEA-like helix-hairpin-helix protein
MTDMLNLNTAQTNDLAKLPGVGAVMADRIVAARPFEKPEDLLKVSGVGPSLLERLTPLVTVRETEIPEDDSEVLYLAAEIESEPQAAEALPETEPSDEAPESEPIPTWEGSEAEMGEDLHEDEVSNEKTVIPVEEAESPKETTLNEPKPVTWGQAMLMAVVCSFVAFILAVLLSLGIVGSLNGGLRYASTEQFQNLSSQVGTLDSEIGTMIQDIGTLRTRLDNLEGLSGRIGALETETGQLSENMAATNALIEEIKAQIADIIKDAERFQGFLDGLGNLLDGLTEQP